MKPHSLFLVAMLCLMLPLTGRVMPGDSMEKMRLELGEPMGEIVRGDTIIYSYPQGGVHVRDGRVARLSDGFYEAVDQITRQSNEGQIQRNLGNETSALGMGEDADALQWYSDWSEATQFSEQRQLPLLIVFSQSGDCPNCREWEGLLSDAVFVDYARDQLVLLWVEDPQIGVQQEPSSTAPQPWERDPVESTPALRLFAPDQSELGRLSYEPMIPETLVAHLESMMMSDSITAQEQGGPLLQGEFGDAMDRLMFIDGISGSAILLSAQIFAGCVLSFLLIRRWMRK